MSAVASRSWSVLRALRADPPGRAGSGSRKSTFAAALEQSEQLWAAGKGLSPTASPIVLFYSLTQGARALAAASVKGSEWTGMSGHGFRLTSPAAPDNGIPRLRDLSVRPSGQGFVQQIAALLGSGMSVGETSLAALVQALPTSERLLLNEPHVPIALQTNDGSHNISVDDDERCLSVGPLPAELTRYEQQGDFSGQLVPSVEEVEQWLTAYPALRGLGAPLRVEQGGPLDFDVPEYRWTVNVVWPAARAGDHQTHYAWAASVCDVPYDWRLPAQAGGLILPSVGGSEQPIKPIIAWWMLLFGCSMLARYHPRTWRQVLDVDRSPDAVPAELLLARAAELLPELLLEALHATTTGQ